MAKSLDKYLESLMVPKGEAISLDKDFETDHNHDDLGKEEGELLMQESIKNLGLMQDKLYASKQYSVLIILQGMDTSGKDGLIKHVMSGVNPVGMKVHSFKVPTEEELAHDYFWRHNKVLPPRGDIALFNRSYYENVLITRVHPELILADIPTLGSVDNIGKSFWEERFKQINHYEKSLVQNGTIILKFFLHLSKKEQHKRLLDRIDDPAKNWKFDTSDLKERGFWKEYKKAYEDLIGATSTEHAPWFVLPADDKWFTRLCMSRIAYNQFEKLKLIYPQVSAAKKAELQQVKENLMAENGK